MTPPPAAAQRNGKVQRSILSQEAAVTSVRRFFSRMVQTANPKPVDYSHWQLAKVDTFFSFTSPSSGSGAFIPSTTSVSENAESLEDFFGDFNWD